MDAVILAAGRNDRLSGHVPAYMKPLLVMDGHTLIGRIIKSLAMANRIIIVCSPENVKQVVDVTFEEDEDDRLRYLVQPHPWGAMNAFELGLELVTSDYVVLACADNIIPDDHWARFLAVRPTEREVLISSRELPPEEAMRFTYFPEDGSVAEKVEPPPGPPSYTCWIGPLGFQTSYIRELAANAGQISEVLEWYEPQDRRFIEGRCSDIGVPGELP